MNPVLYNIVLAILVGLLCVLLGYLCFSIFVDYCSNNDEENLHKYAFGRTDVEDLTQIRGDFKRIRPNLSCKNEVNLDKADRLLNKHKYLSDIAEDSLSDIYSTVYSIEELGENNKSKEMSKENIVSINSSLNGDQYETKSSENINGNQSRTFNYKTQISSSVDNLEFCDPHAIDILKSINNIEDVAKNIEREIDIFIGGVKNLKYFELNEKLIRCMIALSDIMCHSEELRKRKAETSHYIGEMQMKLKNKVG